MAAMLAAPKNSIGHWLPKDPKVLQAWLEKELKEFRSNKVAFRGQIALDPSLQRLKDIVDGDKTLTQQSNDMFTQVPPHWNNDEDPTGQARLESFEEMLYFINDRVMGRAPQWYHRDEMANDLIGFPINAILDWPMGTQAGLCFFLNLEVNEGWKGVLNAWGHFLTTEDSRDRLNKTDGWLSEQARAIIAAKGEGPSFEELFVCDPKDPYYGYKSWDDFFIRKFNDGVRPVPIPDDPQMILNSCESAPLDPPVVSPAPKYDSYWVKGHPYSLVNMLANDPLVDQFVGGTIYQAFLSALSYHRWHAPVNGKVLKVMVVDGTYYSEATYWGFQGGNPDPSAPNLSQQYISNCATRGVIFIEADNPAIGIMAIVYIGMAEVSSCEFTVQAGQSIKKGDIIGQFHFGGSSHCMLFRPGVKVGFVDPAPDGKNNKVNSPLARVV